MKQVSREDKVKEFMIKAKQDVDVPYEEWNEELMDLRINLMSEEWGEVYDEFDKIEGRDYTTDKWTRAALLKELCDLQYVLSGTAVALGLPLEEAFNRVHSNNMTKFGEDGKGNFRDDGKLLKPKDYKPCNLEDLV